MLESKISNRACSIITSIFFVCFSSYTMAQSVNVIFIQEIKPDRACGPRCLWALMQISKSGQLDCGIKCIYELIGKEPFTATNLKDLKNAAEQLGFSANGYKLTISKLTKTKGYAILPVGSTSGTSEYPLHFILVKRIINDYVIAVNTKTLVTQALLVSDLNEYWNGYALIITAGKGMGPLRKEPDDIEQLPKRVKMTEFDETKDFGLVDSGSIVEHTFTIITEKDKDYKAKIVQKNCACLKAKLGRDINGRHTLTMELHVGAPAWQSADAVVLLEPGGIIKRYAVGAYGSDTFEIWPKIAHIEAPDGGLVEYPVKIDYFTGSDDVVMFNRMESALPNLKCGTVESESSTKKGATTFTFNIPLILDAGKPPVRVESLSGSVDFIFDTGKGQRHIPLSLSAEVGAERFRITPEKVFLMTAKSSTSPARTKVKLEFLTEPIPANIDVKLDKHLPLELTKIRVSPDTYTIDIAVVPEKLQDASIGMNKGEVTIVPEGVPELAALTLPISLFVRE
jgi:predicted double-glycine peptidase